ncbi:protein DETOXIFICATION 46, chloroplastic-like [Juglans regia]|uniref:Protein DETOXIFICATION 46, chloroplastic-like n=1 Tax=Juglans regia TaxID=51240 RepID=A0A2I4E7B6_JUGRE|nr:protein DETOXIFICATION 46, chloroplastic-like [Juglans regia]
MRKVLIPFFLALAVTPLTHSLEGTLLVDRDLLKFLSLSMSGCFSAGALLLLLISSSGYGLPGCWFGLVGFQWAPFSLSLRRLLSPNGILYSEDLSHYKLEKLRAVWLSTPNELTEINLWFEPTELRNYRVKKINSTLFASTRVKARSALYCPNL